MASPAMAESRPLIGPDKLDVDPRFAAYDGCGMSVAVLDTGIDFDHPFFGTDADGNGVAEWIVYQWDFAGHDPDAGDRNGFESQGSRAGRALIRNVNRGDKIELATSWPERDKTSALCPPMFVAVLWQSQLRNS